MKMMILQIQKLANPQQMFQKEIPLLMTPELKRKKFSTIHQQSLRLKSPKV